MNAKNEITGWQLFFIIVQTQIGIAILAMPTDISKVAKHDAWISMLLAGLLIQLVLLTYFFLLMKYPENTYFDMIEKCLGKFIGRTIAVLYLAYFMYVMVISLNGFEQVITSWIFEETPKWVVLLLYIIPAVYLARESVVILARFKMLISFLIPVLVFSLFWVYLSNPQYLYLFPIGGTGTDSIIKGVQPAIFALIGFEAFLFFGSYVKRDKAKNLKIASFGTLFVTVFYIFVIVTTQIFFYVDEMIIVPYPVLYIMKALEFTVVQRIDLIFLTIWMMIACSSFTSYLFLGANTLGRVFNQEKHTKMVYLIIIIVYGISFFPETETEVAEWTDLLMKISILFSIAIPFVILLISLFKKKNRKEQSA
ncbi:GerAB/ArcD/ProY family transporter [Jeotgalibacillus proteolyticus]|uniref:Uncharacterized protein n=1 Tax=Jeotgalibacillus proteolyticus TaxID=2082395 RepID=A0A2S5GDW4_9BACL|nr:GerAB/ArcD/ProY family transporter [Jeotgalibacillus proteolyticus]PPA71186.1 hypothetical protein C4B60_03720 [Jeotgalibacillus proteolyticus]